MTEEKSDSPAEQEALEMYEEALTHLIPLVHEAIDGLIDKGIKFPRPLPKEVGLAVVSHAIIASGVILAQEQRVPYPVIQFMLQEALSNAHEVEMMRQGKPTAEADPPKPIVTLT